MRVVRALSLLLIVKSGNTRRFKKTMSYGLMRMVCAILDGVSPAFFTTYCSVAGPTTQSDGPKDSSVAEEDLDGFVFFSLVVAVGDPQSPSN